MISTIDDVEEMAVVTINVCGVNNKNHNSNIYYTIH